jgi:carboxypeptidase Taq
MTANDAYARLIAWSQQATLLGSCIELLGWDEETYLPRGGVEQRARQLSLMAGLQHERLTDPRVGEWLEALSASPFVENPAAVEAVNVRLLRRLHDRACRLPRGLVEESAEVTALAQQEWAIAKRRSDFARFLPWLERVVNIKRREAAAYAGGLSLYDALLDEYEPGVVAADLLPIFADLRASLRPLWEKIVGSTRQPDRSILQRRFPLPRQRLFVQKAAASLGFDFKRGRLDTATTHPFFAPIGPGDCRITTRFALNGFGEAFFATLHEVGHGLYEQGLPAEAYGTPLGEAASLGLHESQARLWENAVGRSRGFWQHFFPLAQRAFPGALRGVSLDDFHFAVQQVGPSLNRVRADEVTYNFHISIRVELERALIAGDLQPADLPAAWNECYQRDLGLLPTCDAEGCLQDGHWAAGMFGYFPTYTLGNLMAAQLMAQATAELSDLESAFAAGEFGVLLNWLRRKVHQQGSRWPASELIHQVTGSKPHPQPLIDFLWKRYSEAYRIGDAPHVPQSRH